MEVRCASNPKDVKHYTTERLREEFHISGLFTNDNIKMVYSHIDRIITAGIMPVTKELKLEGGKELASEYFLERRELGFINVGGDGTVTLDGVKYPVAHKEGMYVGMGTKEIVFESNDKSNPAKYYINSAPAHKTYPTVLINKEKARKVHLGDEANMNKRVINQFVHPAVCQSCQLAMGMTELCEGSGWNTMPCHTHERRMEVYMYFDLGPNDVVFHLMGTADQTRHIVMRNEQLVISPSWSIHSGIGTKHYTFIWGMCGENQEFDDMDHIKMTDLY